MNTKMTAQVENFSNTHTHTHTHTDTKSGTKDLLNRKKYIKFFFYKERGRESEREMERNISKENVHWESIAELISI